MATEVRARVCVVSGCPAMAAAGIETCQVRAIGRRLEKGSVDKRCCKCGRLVKPGTWITPHVSADGAVEHVTCPRKRDADE